MEQVVFETVKKQIALCETLAQIIDEINQAPVVRNQSTRIEKQLKTKEQELHKVTNLCDSLYIDWKSGDLTREEYHRMKAKFEEQAEEIRQTIANLQEEQTFVSKRYYFRRPVPANFFEVQEHRPFRARYCCCLD